MFVILTSKPGQYRTVPSADIELLEAWDYLFYGRLQAQFVIGKLLRETKVQVVEEDASGTVNRVPSKFLERFDTLSLGMTADLDAAIAAGSTIVRVGTGIFGGR